jgi:hypothetical protein
MSCDWHDPKKPVSSSENARRYFNGKEFKWIISFEVVMKA